MEIDVFNKKKETARKFYEKLKPLYCPYLDGVVVFNSKGFHHLRYSAGSERPKGVQVLKFALLPLAIKIIKNSATLQEYKKELQTFGRPDKAGMKKTKEVEYLAFIAIVTTKKVKVRVILRRIGTGNFIFWSVMPDVKMNPGEVQRLYKEGIDEA